MSSIFLENGACSKTNRVVESGADSVRRRLERIIPVENSREEAEQYRRFEIRSEDLMRAELAARKTGRDVPGFYHIIINVDTKISNVYSSPYDQAREQPSPAIESLHERQESRLVNSDDYGLFKNVADSQHIQTRNGRPMPGDLDELPSKA